MPELSLPVIPYGDFLTQFNKQIYNLSYSRQLDLAIKICEKLLPEYSRFYEMHSWGNPNILLDAIAFIKVSDSSRITPSIVNEITLKLESVTPDMDDYGSGLGSYALNACTAIYEALEFLLDKAPGHIYDIGIAYTDTIDFKIQEENELSELQTDKHPLMIGARHFLLNQTRE